MDSKQLINTLKAQHKVLKTDLIQALDDAEKGIEKNESEILQFLSKFKTDLTEHVKLENDIFYPDYLDRKLKRGEDITETSKFVDEMKKIGYGVTQFLEKYDTPEELEDIKRDFEGDLKHIIETLNIRISTEEDSVFELYLIMGD